MLSSHPRALVVTALVALLVIAGVWLRSESSSVGARLVRASYDWSHALAKPWRPALEDSPVVLVYLDTDSYLAEKQNPAEPWDRALHAKLVRRLTRAGARAVVFDIIFSEPGRDAEADREFGEAIRGNGRVILAGELVQSGHEPGDTLGTRTHQATLPNERFRDTSAGWGLANLIPDEDFVVRRYFATSRHQSLPSLTMAAAQFLSLPLSSVTNQSLWLRYYGRALALPHVSYSHALTPGGVPDEFFRDKIVFIGARPMTGGFTERRDEFRSPFPSWRRDLFVPAVEVHATQMLDLVRGDWVRRFPPRLEGGLLMLCAAVFGWSLFRFRPVPAAAAALAGELVVLAMTLFAFTQGGIWFPWLVVSAVQIPVALGGSILFHSLEWSRARRLLEALRREAEAKIKEQAALIDKAQDAILLQDLAGRIVYANPSAIRLYGWSSEQLTTDDVTGQLFAPCATKAAEARQTTLARGEWQGELDQVTRAGQKLVVESRWTLIKNEQGQPKSMLLINTDITEKKRLESQFLRTQRLEAIWSLAGGMAHDLNNALAPVLMGIQRLRKKTTDEETGRMLSVMESNTNRGADMVRQVLTFSRGSDGEQELLNPGQLLHELERIVAQTFPKSISVAVLAPRDLWPVLGNATQLHQVLLNLCVNARDAMPNGGQLTLAADNVELTVSEAKDFSNATPGQFVMLLVADTGTGIASDVVPHLFEPFFTTKPAGRGTGLGLSTTAHIVRQHGGFLNLKSEVGMGTTVEVYLPRATNKPAAVIRSAAADVPLGRQELILVIDDDRSVRDMLGSTLVEHGYRVVAAPNGAAGLTLLGQHAEAVRLVLLDFDMPVMNGAATLAAIRNKHPRLPAVLMSGEGEIQASPACSSASGGLSKPFRVEQLLRVVRDELDASRPG